MLLSNHGLLVDELQVFLRLWIDLLNWCRLIIDRSHFEAWLLERLFDDVLVGQKAENTGRG